MTSPDRDSIFTPSFLTRLLAEPGSSSPDATTEADWAGPWTVVQYGEKWAVIAEGEDQPSVVAVTYDTALLAAALLPGTGRGRLVHLLQEATPDGFPLLGAMGEVLAHGRHFVPDLAQAMHAFECVRRSPLDLARFLEACRGSALLRAGRILWAWDQAPPRQREGSVFDKGGT
jgi:hypothetical protein